MLTGKERFLGLFSPIFVTIMLSFLSGIPILERQNMKTFGSDPEYRTYKKQTPILIPFIRFP